jgi:hypothetical protein
MKTNKYADLIKFGFKSKTLMTLSESDISKLHKNLVEGKKDVCPKCGKKKCECKMGKKKIETNEKEEKMIKQTTYDPKNTVDRNELASKGYKVDPVTLKVQLNQGKEEEGNEAESKGKNNPLAICHAQVGPKKSAKFERCVRQVKKQMQENKLPFDRILENKILSLVEKHLKPKMKKGDLMNLISKKKMKLPICKLGSMGGNVSEDTKEKEAPVKNPGTKTPPKPKTKDPFRPEPHKQPNPKAKKETKEEVMDAPVKEPKVTPGTKTPPKPKTKDPFRPEPHKQPNPKAKKKTTLPSWLTFNNLGIKFKK